MKKRRKLMIDKCPFCKKDHYKKNLIIVDIDGTLCKHAEPCNEKSFINAPPLKKRINLINNLYRNGSNIILQTGRPESGRTATMKWLFKHKVSYDCLIMEKSGYVFVLDDSPVLSTWIPLDWNKNNQESNLNEVLK